jgi:histidinol-phosphate phosphatase family protein
MGHKAVFLDRDGTIARDVKYCRRANDLKIFSGVPEAISLMNKNNFKVVIVTNQSGIARGYFDEMTLEYIHQEMKSQLAKSGAYIDAVYYCPHMPADDCHCRKPETYLFRRAAADLNLNIEDSFIVGDTAHDIDAGKALGCKTVLVTTGLTGGKDVINPPDCIASSLLEAARWIADYGKTRGKSSHDNKR